MPRSEWGGGVGIGERKLAVIPVTCVHGWTSPAKCFGIFSFMSLQGQLRLFKSDVVKDDFLVTM